MKKKHIIVSQHDYDILKTLCYQTAGTDKLKEELNKAVIRKTKVPEDVVQVNSTLEFKDERSGAVRQVQLVLPAASNIQQGKLSILSPIGTALLGYSTGDTIDWEVPAGKTQLHILRVMNTAV
ncbi:nucleoside diphosphate kinase regulator [Chitinophaga nivalis]|uniref:Nucleoside diphosphate kinase regulator n=1 Tax=Chitinophaga nivalis TaxID=2991709 RepID=A0ABT3INR8_9BACT|nr:nucleoside diphosphate kinase regulator [Chitinophaga nivalis]MCW3464699.1 nucleoside diphosphate kinase regulator [Chitinophaga nivalis]MCW3485610.1 nucleoside diphosphate kinase regulator [Chitinophaga nivalis]